MEGQGVEGDWKGSLLHSECGVQLLRMRRVFRDLLTKVLAKQKDYISLRLLLIPTSKRFGIRIRYFLSSKDRGIDSTNYYSHFSYMIDPQITLYHSFHLLVQPSYNEGQALPNGISKLLPLSSLYTYLVA